MFAAGGASDRACLGFGTAWQQEPRGACLACACCSHKVVVR